MSSSLPLTPSWPRHRCAYRWLRKTLVGCLGCLTLRDVCSTCSRTSKVGVEPSRASVKPCSVIWKKSTKSGWTFAGSWRKERRYSIPCWIVARLYVVGSFTPVWWSCSPGCKPRFKTFAWLAPWKRKTSSGTGALFPTAWASLTYACFATQSVDASHCQHAVRVVWWRNPF
jgi:hypothetical protein